MKKLIILYLCLFCSSFASAQKIGKEFKQLKSNLSGRFTNEDQGRFNPAYQPEQLTLRPMGPEKPDVVWIYVEEAPIAGTPTRQWVWGLEQKDKNRYLLTFYDLKDPNAFAEEWKKKKPFESFDPQLWLNRKQCPANMVRKTYTEFTGGTPEDSKSCRDLNADVAYTTVEVFCSASTVMFWERTFDAEDKQLSGPVGGGKIFRKVELFK